MTQLKCNHQKLLIKKLLRLNIFKPDEKNVESAKNNFLDTIVKYFVKTNFEKCIMKKVFLDDSNGLPEFLTDQKKVDSLQRHQSKKKTENDAYSLAKNQQKFRESNKESKYKNV